jgi:multidrug resistance efflux pump
MTKAPTENQLVKLTTLLQLEREARHADSFTELGFVAVNETHRLLSYQQAILWRYTITGGLKVEAASNVAQVEKDAPFVHWCRNVFKHLVRQEDSRSSHNVSREDLPEEFHEGWQEWSPGHALWVPLIAHGELVGGMWLTRAAAWQAAEITLLDRVADAYAHAWEALAARERKSLRERMRQLVPSRRFQVAAILAALVVMLFPVRESALAPAEVIADEPIVVSAPVDGVIEKFHVKPNQPVKAGQSLFDLDDTTLRNRHEVAQKALMVARAAYLRSAQKAFQEEESKAELALLKARVDEKAAEVRYTGELLDRIQVRAKRDGIAVFDDPNDWIGRPVATGQKVMEIADPTRTELQAWVPVGDAINMEAGAPVRFFLNTDPTRPLSAKLYQAGYEAQPTPDGALAFRVKARFDEAETLPRIGLKGTAKVYGDRVIFIYHILRRPLAAARQFLGW